MNTDIAQTAENPQTAENSNLTSTGGAEDLQIPTIPGTLGDIVTAKGERWGGSREQALWRLHLRVSTQLLLQLDGELNEEENLSLADYSVLVVIAESPVDGVRMSNIAEYVMISRSRLTHCIDRLENRGLVERIKAEDDKRGFRCVLLDKGRKLLDTAVATHVAGVRRFFVDLVTDEEAPVVEAVYNRMLRALSQPGGREGTMRLHGIND
jgi:DNA-binding MarR family transcriptional regulator